MQPTNPLALMKTMRLHAYVTLAVCYGYGLNCYHRHMAQAGLRNEICRSIYHELLPQILADVLQARGTQSQKGHKDASQVILSKLCKTETELSALQD